MKINRLNNNIFFQKHLVANGAVKAGGICEDVKIYKFDNTKDRQDLLKAQQSQEWQDSYYLCDAIYDFPRFFVSFDYYTLEDKNKNVLCFCIVDNKRSKHTKLEYLETAPEYSCYNKDNRPYKYIGETMMAYLAELSKSKEKDFLVDYVANRPKTKNFYYKQCNFKKDGSRNAILPKSKLEQLIEKNAQHTGKKVELVV